MPVDLRSSIYGLLIICLLSSAVNSSFGQDSRSPEGMDDEQDYDSLLNAYLTYDSLLLAELENDTLSIFGLIDSLLHADLRVSSLSLRFGYNSSILNAGRDFGFKQYGFSGGLSYQHKTGLFVDLLGYWNSEVDPNYYLNTFSIGYFGTVTSRWSFMASYDHFFYRESTEFPTSYPFNNALNLSSYIDLKYVSGGLDYSYLFGESNAHRLRPSFSGIVRIKDVGPLNRVTIMPTASMLFGNSIIISQSTNLQLLQQIIRKIGWRNFLLLYERRREEVESLIFPVTQENVFGLMNYSFTLPVYMYVKNLSILTSYTINFPVALPGESIDTRANSFFGATLIYSFYFK